MFIYFCLIRYIFVGATKHYVFSIRLNIYTNQTCAQPVLWEHGSTAS
jgi:hypothetical protein